MNSMKRVDLERTSMKPHASLKTGLRSALVSAIFTLTTPMAMATEYTGTVQFEGYVELGTQVSGTVTTIKVNAGETVKKGAVLLALDGRGFRAELNAAKAELAVAENDLDVAEREQERAEELYDRGSLSDHDLQLARNGFSAAEAKVARAQAGKVAAELDASRSVIRAPYKARVLRVMANKGQVVLSGLRPESLVAVAAGDRFRVRVPVRAAQFASTQVGTEVNVRVGEQARTGKVSAVAYEPGNQAPYAVYVAIALSEGEAIPLGQSATVDLP